MCTGVKTQINKLPFIIIITFKGRMQGIFHAWQVLCHWIISPAIFLVFIHTQHSPLPVPGVSDSYHPILGTALPGRQEQSSKLHSLPNSRPSYFLKSRKSVQVILRMISGLLICFWKHSSNRQMTSPAVFPRFTWVLTSPAFLACEWGQWSAAAHSDRGLHLFWVPEAFLL